MAGISKPQGYRRQVCAKYGQEIYILRLPFRVSSISVRSEIAGGLETPRLLPTSPHECCQEIYLLRLPFWVLSMHESDLRLAGVLKLRGYRQQVRTNAARKFTSYDFPFGFRRCMSPI
jgi:hypothetical protein